MSEPSRSLEMRGRRVDRAWAGHRQCVRIHGRAGLAVFRIDRRLPERSKAWGCHGWAWVVVVVRVCLWLSCRQQDRQVGLGSESQDWGGVWSAQADAQPAHGAMGHREGTGRAVCDVLIGILNIALPWSPPMLSDVCSGKSSGG